MYGLIIFRPDFGALEFIGCNNWIHGAEGRFYCVRVNDERVLNAIAADTRLRFWGARPSRVLVLLSRQHALLRTKGTQETVRSPRDATTHTRDAYAPPIRL